MLKLGKKMMFFVMTFMTFCLVGCGNNTAASTTKEMGEEIEKIEEENTVEIIDTKTENEAKETEKISETDVAENNGKTEEVQGVENEIYYTEVEEVVYATATVNIRSMPSTDSEIVDKLYRNKSITRIGISEEWSKVIYNDTECFIAAEYLTTEEPVIKEHLIAIDAGHQKTGNSEQEPIGPGSSTTKAKVASGTTGIASGVPEYQLTLEVALKLRDELVARGYEVLMIRESHDVDISNAKRAEMANAAGAEAFIRIHANGSENTGVSGILTMCQTSSNPYNSGLYSQSRSLSEKILSEMVAATGGNNKGIIETDAMSGINWCQIPVTIVEMGFMSNANEDQLMQTQAYQEKMVQGIANGVDSYFGD